MSGTERAVPHGEGRQAILRAAITLVSRDGLGKLTYRSLAAEARVAVGLVRHHFESLDDVLEHALQVCYELHTDRMRTATGFLGIIDVLVAALDDPDQLELTQFEYEVTVGARYRPSLQRAVESYYADFRRFAAAALVAANQPADQATVELLTALADGIAFERVVLGKKQLPRMRAQVEALTRLLPPALVSREIN
ncbi:TetR/AcrR family transcriptional regulator [Nocardia sp. NPDC059246]|uniref:TetR/AcrR family transcriptional regulator n=1 Tax=unclassified Nocardia TaxID=2637762 RepID=UPI0036A6B124